MKELIEQIGGRARLEQIVEFGQHVPEAALMARALLEVLDAKKCHAVAKHYAGCKYPVVKMNGMEIIIAGDREDAEEVAELISTLYLTPPADSVPDGWKLVPIEATPDMLDASWKLHGIHHPSAYRTMIAAAPAPGGDNG